MTGNLDEAKGRLIEAAEADRQAGNPEVEVLRSELEALRIDIMQGRAEAARPEVEGRLARVQGWWDRHRASEAVPEAPNAEALARALISALDIAREGDYARQDWASALGRRTPASRSSGPWGARPRTSRPPGSTAPTC